MLTILEMYHDEIRELNDEISQYFNDCNIDTNASFLVSQKLCEAAFWMHQLYHASKELQEGTKIKDKPLKIVKDEKNADS